MNTIEIVYFDFIITLPKSIAYNNINSDNLTNLSPDR